MNKMKDKKNIGLLMIVTSMVLWGLSGPVIEWLFMHTKIQPVELLTLRLLTAGLFILLYLGLKGEDIWSIWKQPRQFIPLLAFGLLGMLGAQYAFIVTLDVSNAVTATLFQFLGPVLITVYAVAQQKKLPTKIQATAVCAALVGVYFLVTNGAPDCILLSSEGIFWGAMTAIGFAYYTVCPTQMIKEWGAQVIVGWGMLIGGIGVSIINPALLKDGTLLLLGIKMMILVAIVVVMGILAFLLYIGSLRYVAPSKAGLLSSIEPLVTFIAAIGWLKQSFGIYQIVGGICIVATVILLAREEEEEPSFHLEASNIN